MSKKIVLSCVLSFLCKMPLYSQVEFLNVDEKLIDDQKVVISKALTLIDSNPERALEILMGSNEYSQIFKSLGDVLSERCLRVSGIKERNSKLESYFSCLTFCNRYFDTLDEVDFISDGFASFFGSFTNKRNMLSLKGRDEHEMYSSILLDNQLNIYKYGLVNRDVGEKAFAKLYRHYLKEGKGFELLEKEVLDTLRYLAEAPKNVDSSEKNVSIYLHLDREIPNKLRFITERMKQSKNVELVSDELIAKLNITRPSLAKSFKFFKKHILLSEASLEKEILNLGTEPTVTFYHWDQLLLVKKSDKLNHLLAEKIMKAILDEKLIVSRGDNRELLLCLTDSLTSSAHEVATSKLTKIFDHLATKILADAKGVTKLDQWLDSFKDPTPEMISFQSILGDLMSRSEGVKLAAEVIKRYDYPYHIDNNARMYLSGLNLDRAVMAGDWFLMMEKSGYLTSTDKFKVMSLPFVNVQSKATTDLGLFYLAQSFRPGYQVIDRLQSIEGEKRLVAQLLIGMYDGYLKAFCVENKNEILNSPMSFKKAIVSIFNLKHNKENQKVFREAGILDRLLRGE